MTSEEFDIFRHKAVHALIDLNEACNEKFNIGEWERWDYDFDAGTLIFSEAGNPKVVATIQVVGTTSTISNTWMWAWANESLPPRVTEKARRVLGFGKSEGLDCLTDSVLPNDEHLAWEMTAMAARIAGGIGAYRCPDENGCVYVIYTDVRFADAQDCDRKTRQRTLECDKHGTAYITYVCEHLVSNPEQEWFSKEPTEENPWPDAWCQKCDVVYLEQGEWNDKNSGVLKIKLICHLCYELLRSRDTSDALENSSD